MVGLSSFRDLLLSLCLFAGIILFMLLVYLPVSYPTNGVKKSLDVNVEGWGENVSRWLPAYIRPDNETSILRSTIVCNDDSQHGDSQHLTLLIVVCSAVVNFAQREAIRETWGNSKTNAVETYKLVFLLGLTDNNTLQERIEAEALVNNDIIQEDFIDSYNNLTLKSVMMLKFIKFHCEKKVDFILKCDDDMFIHVPNLLILIQGITQMKLRHVLIGELICNAKPITDVNSKWYSPSYMFDKKIYPRYLSGTGYLMNFEAAIKLYEAALVTPFFHLEDVYITGMCANKSKIRPQDHAGFSYETRPLDPCLYLTSNGRHRIITSHRVSPVHMRKLWSSIKNHQKERLNCTSATPRSSFIIGNATFRKNAKNKCL